MEYMTEGHIRRRLFEYAKDKKFKLYSKLNFYPQLMVVKELLTSIRTGKKLITTKVLLLNYSYPRR